LDTNSEQDIFKALLLKYVPPEKRWIIFIIQIIIYIKPQNISIYTFYKLLCIWL
jgi:hypothetical protein